MKLLNHSNVIAISAGAASMSLGRATPSNYRRPRDKRIGLLEQLKRQTQEYERAIEDTESARLSLEESSRGTVEALNRFEQTLQNLKLSLRNHRDVCSRIESASVAGEAAALLKAQIMGDGSYSLECHRSVQESMVKSVLHDPPK